MLAADASAVTALLISGFVTNQQQPKVKACISTDGDTHRVDRSNPKSSRSQDEDPRWAYNGHVRVGGVDRRVGEFENLCVRGGQTVGFNLIQPTVVCFRFELRRRVYRCRLVLRASGPVARLRRIDGLIWNCIQRTRYKSGGETAIESKPMLRTEVPAATRIRLLRGATQTSQEGHGHSRADAKCALSKARNHKSVALVECRDQELRRLILHQDRSYAAFALKCKRVITKSQFASLLETAVSGATGLPKRCRGVSPRSATSICLICF